MSQQHWIGVDLGGTKILAGLFAGGAGIGEIHTGGNIEDKQKVAIGRAFLVYLCGTAIDGEEREETECGEAHRDGAGERDGADPGPGRV